VLVLALVVGMIAVSTAARVVAQAASPATAYVDVTVATLWTSPSSPRSVDRPALGDPVDMRAWDRALTTQRRIGLVGRTQTQALLGERVIVVQRRGAWVQIVVPDQPTPRDRRGYPGWVPAGQLRSAPRFGRELAGRIAIVSRPDRLSTGSRVP
jgi:hypothetical protein